VFRSPHFTLLTFGDSAAPRLPDAYNDSVQVYTIARPDSTTTRDPHALIDSQGHAHRAYGIRDEPVILVRPDDYIGLTGGSLEQESIIGYLHKVTGQ
jgi:hypothetical protein